MKLILITLIALALTGCTTLNPRQPNEKTNVLPLFSEKGDELFPSPNPVSMRRTMSNRGGVCGVGISEFMNNQPKQLRSAEEWAKQCADETAGQYFVLTDCRVLEARKVIEKYLLNAYKAGMTEAAAMIGYEDYRHCSNVDCREAILSARDKKGEL